jgi:hypothetical protein
VPSAVVGRQPHVCSQRFAQSPHTSKVRCMTRLITCVAAGRSVEAMPAVAASGSVSCQRIGYICIGYIWRIEQIASLTAAVYIENLALALQVNSRMPVATMILNCRVSLGIGQPGLGLCECPAPHKSDDEPFNGCSTCSKRKPEKTDSAMVRRYNYGAVPQGSQLDHHVTP